MNIICTPSRPGPSIRVNIPLMVFLVVCGSIGSYGGSSHPALSSSMDLPTLGLSYYTYESRPHRRKPPAGVHQLYSLRESTSSPVMILKSSSQNSFMNCLHIPGTAQACPSLETTADGFKFHHSWNSLPKAVLCTYGPPPGKDEFSTFLGEHLSVHRQGPPLL